MSERKIEIARRTAGVRFRRIQEEFAERFASVLGTDFADRAEAALMVSEFMARLFAAEEGSEPFVSRSWTEGDADKVDSTLLRITNAFDPIDCWLVTTPREPLGVSVSTDQGIPSLRAVAEWAGGTAGLFDRAGSGGIWLGRHSHHFVKDVTYEWELNVFGKAWAGIATSVLAVE